MKIKYNDVKIENEKMAQDFINSFSMRAKRYGIAFIAGFIMTIINFSFLFKAKNNVLAGTIVVVCGIIIILVMDERKLIYLLKVIKEAWEYGWDFGFIPAYVIAGAAVSFIATMYFMTPFMGVFISGVRMLRTYLKCKQACKEPGSLLDPEELYSKHLEYGTNVIGKDYSILENYGGVVREIQHNVEPDVAE